MGRRLYPVLVVLALTVFGFQNCGPAFETPKDEDNNSSGNPTPSPPGAHKGLSLGPITPPLEDTAPRIVVVKTVAELKAALTNQDNNIDPGTVIEIEAGEYQGYFPVQLQSASETGADGDRYIVIRGKPGARVRLIGDNSVGNDRGTLTLLQQHHILIENLEILGANQQYTHGIYVGGTNKGGLGSHHLILRNLYVHDSDSEPIKIRGRKTHQILVERNTVHSNQDGSGIDVQGHWDRDMPYAEKPSQIAIRNNLIFDINGGGPAAGVANEFADQIHIYNNVVLGSSVGLDIGCGNYNVVADNLITSYDIYLKTLAKKRFLRIPLLLGFVGSWVGRDGLIEPDPEGYMRLIEAGTDGCKDGIAMSGNYLSLIARNEITDCKNQGDLIMSYNHRLSIEDGDHNSEKGHQYNVFYANAIHNNSAYYTIKEEDKGSKGGLTKNSFYFANLFANNSYDGSKGMHFDSSSDLSFFNNTVLSGVRARPEKMEIDEASSPNRQITNNLLFHVEDLPATDVGGNSLFTFEPGDTNFLSSLNLIFTSALLGIYLPKAATPEEFSTEQQWYGKGENLSAELVALETLFKAQQATQFDYYSEITLYGDFPEVFRFALDQPGKPFPANDPWDRGAYQIQ